MEEIAQIWTTPTELMAALVAPGEGTRGGRRVRETFMGDLEAFIAGEVPVVPGVESFKFVGADGNELRFPLQLISRP